MKRKTLGVAILTTVLLFTGALPASAATQNWSTPVDLTTSGVDAYSPQIATAPDGTITALWYRMDGANSIIQSSSSTDHGATWTAPVNVSATGQYAASQQITAAPDSSLTAIWYRYDGANNIIQTSHSTDGGATWTSPIDLSSAGRNASSPQLVAAPNGAVTAIWTASDGSNYIIQAANSTDGGATWASPVNLSDPGHDAIAPQATVAADGTLTAVWYRYDGSTYVIQAANSTDHGATWSTATNLSSTSQSAGNPQVTAAPDGTLTAVWEVFDGAFYQIQTASSTDHGTTWSTPTYLSVNIGQDARAAQVVAAADGTITAVWYQFDNAGNAIVQTASSTDRGSTWSTPANLSAASQNAFAPDVLVGSDGTLTVVWHRFDGSTDIIQASNSTDKGASWSTPINLSVAGQNAFNPQLTTAADGTLTAVWYRSNGSNFIIQSSVGHTSPVITSATLPTPVIGTAYSFQVVSTGAPAPTFTLSSGTLPTGLAISPSGVISGTATTLGNYTFTITASNGIAPGATASYTLSPAVQPTPAGPTSPGSTSTATTAGTQDSTLANSGSTDPTAWILAALLMLALGAGLIVAPQYRRTGRNNRRQLSI